MNKIILILFFPVMAQLVFSCCCCDDDPVAPEMQSSSVNEVELFTIDNTADVLRLLANDNDGIDSIDKRAFGIYIMARADYIAQCMPKLNDQFFFSKAMACSCGDYLSIQIEKVRNFEIRTLNDFDATRKAGDALTDYFKQYNSTELTFSELPKDSLDIKNGLNLLLLTPPSLSGEFTFEVSFDVNDSIRLVDTTSRVFLL